MEGVVPSSDPYGYLGITPNPDGSITRKPAPTTAASSDPANPILTKDVPINPQTGTWARLYLPRNETTKLPIIVYYHGGGLILGSADAIFNQKFCNNIVLRIQAVVVSVGYRLAPEHRLPAAYDDGMEALHWIRTTEEEWLTRFADLSRCFLAGTSAGGNIAYHVGLRAAKCADQLAPVRIRGVVLQHAFFGGVERTPAEKRGVEDRVLPLCVTDIMWDLALPVGADRDHGYANPTRGVDGEAVEKMKKEGCKVMVTGCGGDIMVDRQREAAKMLEEKGVDVRQEFAEGGYHGIDVMEVDGSYADSFYEVFKNFVLTS